MFSMSDAFIVALSGVVGVYAILAAVAGLVELADVFGVWRGLARLARGAWRNVRGLALAAAVLAVLVIPAHADPGGGGPDQPPFDPGWRVSINLHQFRMFYDFSETFGVGVDFKW